MTTAKAGHHCQLSHQSLGDFLFLHSFGKKGRRRRAVFLMLELQAVKSFQIETQIAEDYKCMRVDFSSISGSHL